MKKATTSLDLFPDDREALDFIASRVADEAQREGVPFSEVERKMLYFSETAWTLPDIWTVSDQFDNDYDQGAYEKKISQLIKKAVARAGKQQQREELEAWGQAIRRLRKHDRYLLVMIGQAGLGRTIRSARPFRKSWRPWAAGLIVAALFSAFVWVLYTISPYPRESYTPSGRHESRLKDAIAFSLWLFPFSIAVMYGLLSLFRKQGKFNEVLDRSLEWIFGESESRK